MTEREPIPGVYRTIRGLSAGREAPWAGTLCQDAAGAAFQVVDADVLGDDWAGWRAAPDSHVLAAVDVVRRTSGHDAVLPVCDEPVTALLDRRAGAGAPLSAGEAVTLGISLLRGMGELPSDAAASCAEWWLTGDGRPVVVSGAGRDDARTATAALVERLRNHVDLSCWGRVHDAVTVERLSTVEMDAAEAALFAEAAPEPLATAVLAPRTARSVTRNAAPEIEPVPPADPWTVRALRHVDGDLADMVSRATTSLWRRARATPGSAGRRSPWAIAGGVAGLIVAGGLLWPTPAEPGPAVSAPPPSATEPATATPAASSAATPAASSAAAEEARVPGATADEDEDLAAVLADLLARRAECGGDQSCLETTAAAASVSSQTLDLPESDRAIELVDDLGDVAVLKVVPRDVSRGTQLVVIVRKDGSWLLRDVHEVLQQP
jgi:hypothetical protein